MKKHIFLVAGSLNLSVGLYFFITQFYSAVNFQSIFYLILISLGISVVQFLSYERGLLKRSLVISTWVNIIPLLLYFGIYLSGTFWGNANTSEKDLALISVLILIPSLLVYFGSGFCSLMIFIQDLDRRPIK